MKLKTQKSQPRIAVGKSRSWLWIVLLVVVLLSVLGPQTALAAPGGKIVSGIFKSFWGRVLLCILVVIFSPLIAYMMIKEHFAFKRTITQLKRLEAVDPNFAWPRLKERITECYHRVHAAWRAEDMAEASEWMTSWYWQNQQLAYLNQWERDGLVNHCRVKAITSIRPLFVKYAQNESGANDGSQVVVSIWADMEDYLKERESGKIVDGAPGFENTEHIWTFALREGKWVVANIEDGTMSLTYAKMKPEVPEVLPAKAAPEPPRL